MNGPAVDDHAARRRRLAGILLAGTVALEGSTLLLIGLVPADRVAAVALIGVRDGLLFFVTWLAFAVVGWLIIRHQPRNAIGWLCAGSGFGVSLIAIATGIATNLLAGDPRSDPGRLAAWIAHSLTMGMIGLPVFVFLRFPTGTPLGPAFARFERLGVVLIGSLLPVVAVAPMPLLGFPATPNPFGLADSPIEPFLWWVTLVMLVLVIVALWALVLRFQRGSTLERRQIALLGAAAALLVLDLAAIPVTSPAIVTTGRLSAPTQVLTAVAMTSIPVAIGIAIARYRLYEIDRIVKRSLVYGVVSAVLFGVYLVAVLVLQAPLGTAFPAEAQTLATAGSTLLVAALFRPVRSRAQAAIDRRFDRERYEATRTIETFAGQVRGEVELDAIASDLVAAARQTVHPSAATCWIRPPTGHGRSRGLGYNRAD